MEYFVVQLLNCNRVVQNYSVFITKKRPWKLTTFHNNFFLIHHKAYHPYLIHLCCARQYNTRLWYQRKYNGGWRDILKIIKQIRSNDKFFLVSSKSVSGFFLSTRNEGIVYRIWRALSNCVDASQARYINHYLWRYKLK